MHSFSSFSNQSPEINYRSEKSILAVSEYKHFQLSNISGQSNRVCTQGAKCSSYTGLFPKYTCYMENLVLTALLLTRFDCRCNPSTTAWKDPRSGQGLVQIHIQTNDFFLVCFQLSSIGKNVISASIERT